MKKMHKFDTCMQKKGSWILKLLINKTEREIFGDEPKDLEFRSVSVRVHKVASLYKMTQRKEWVAFFRMAMRFINGGSTMDRWSQGNSVIAVR